MTKEVPYAPLVSLGDDRLEEIRQRMEVGESMSSLVRLIHESWGALHEMKEPALHKMLSRYRQKVVKPEAQQQLIQAIEQRKPVEIKKAINAMDELTFTLAVQKDRVMKWLEQQSKMSMPIGKEMRDDLRLLKEISRDLALLQLETGILKRAPKTTLSEFFGADGSRSAVVMTEVWEEAMREFDAIELEGEYTDVTGREDRQDC